MSLASPFDRTAGTPSAPSWHTNPRALKAHLDRRPYWVLNYAGSDALYEGDPCRCRRHQEQDWMCRPSGRIERSIGLYAPDGLYHELGGAWYDMTGKLFQLKLGMRALGFGGTGFHLIGAVGGLDGQCLCYSWEYDVFSATGGHIVGPFSDNVYAFAYGGLGQLGIDNLGLRL